MHRHRHPFSCVTFFCATPDLTTRFVHSIPNWYQILLVSIKNLVSIFGMRSSTFESYGSSDVPITLWRIMHCSFLAPPLSPPLFYFPFCTVIHITGMTKSGGKGVWLRDFCKLMCVFSNWGISSKKWMWKVAVHVKSGLHAFRKIHFYTVTYFR